MKKSEFISKSRNFEKRFQKNQTIFNMLFIIIVIAILYLALSVERLSSGYGLFLPTVFIALFFVNSLLSNAVRRYQISNSGLGCKSCKENLLAEKGDIAIATGNCPICGEAAFNDVNKLD